MSRKRKETSVVHDALVLTAITLVSGLLLGIVHDITAEPIAAEEERTRIETEQTVFSDAKAFHADLSLTPEQTQNLLDKAGISKTVINEIYDAQDADGNLLGWVIDVTNSEGYGGDVELMAGIRSRDGSLSLNGISFLSLSETAGMGMKAKDAAFLDQFRGMPADEMIEYTKSGKSADNEIDAISGATVTTSAVTKAVNAAITAAQKLEGGNAS